MIQQFECVSCKGRYFDRMSDGTAYAHACAPLPATDKDPERERPDKRDENIVVERGGKVVGIITEGAGVTCLTDGKIEEPPWISALYKRIEAQEEKENA